MTPTDNQMLRWEQLETHIQSTKVLIAQQEARLDSRASGDRQASETLLLFLQNSLVALLEYQRVLKSADAAIDRYFSLPETCSPLHYTTSAVGKAQ
jgi:hypothetical protein